MHILTRNANWMIQTILLLFSHVNIFLEWRRREITVETVGRAGGGCWSGFFVPLICFAGEKVGLCKWEKTLKFKSLIQTSWVWTNITSGFVLSFQILTFRGTSLGLRKSIYLLDHQYFRYRNAYILNVRLLKACATHFCVGFYSCDA